MLFLFFLLVLFHFERKISFFILLNSLMCKIYINEEYPPLHPPPTHKKVILRITIYIYLTFSPFFFKKETSIVV